MLNKNQHQSTGNDCLAIQAGRDANINIGHTASEVEKIVQISVNALKSNFEEQLKNLTGDKLFIEEQLKVAIRALALKSLDANENDASKLKFENALTLIKDGNTSKAESLFLEIEESELKSIEASTKKVVDAALNRGALAFMRDTNSSISAYERVLKLEPNNLIAIGHLARLFMRKGNFTRSENLYFQLLSIAQKNKQHDWVASAYYSLGQVNFCKGELRKSHEMLNISLKIMQSHGNLIGISSIYLEIINIHIEQSNLSQAKDITEKLISIAAETDDQDLLARSNATKGIIHSKLNEYVIAEEALTFSLNYYKDTENLEGLAEAYGNLGIVYKNKGDFPLAEKMYTASLKLETQLSRKSGIASDLANIANLHKLKKEYDLALTKCQEALKIANEIKSKSSLAMVHASLGGIYFSKENFLLAKENYEISRKYERESGNTYRETEQLINLSTTHSALNEYSLSLACLKKAKAISIKHNHASQTKLIRDRIKTLSR
ncbi:tetratricopeptide repeat protein [Pseudomonas sp. S2_H10]|jgi:tetratricopeptide (TPR) repeat protein